MGVNIHSLDDSALQSALSNGNLEVVKSLIEHGAHVHAQDNEALVRTGRNIEVVAYLGSLM